MRSELFTQSTTGQVTFDVVAICSEVRELLLSHSTPLEARILPRWVSVVISGFRNCLVVTNQVTVPVDWVSLFERLLHEEDHLVWLMLPQAGDRTSIFFRRHDQLSWDDSLYSNWYRWLRQVPPLSRMHEAMFRIPIEAMDAWRDGLSRFWTPPCFACFSFKATEVFDLWAYFREDDTVAPTCLLLEYEDMFMDLAARAPVLTVEKWIQTLQWHSPCLHTIPFAITHNREVDRWFLPHHLFNEYNRCLDMGQKWPRSDIDGVTTCLVGWLTQLAGMWRVADTPLGEDDPQLAEVIQCSDEFGLARATITYAHRCRVLEGRELAPLLKSFFSVAIVLRRIARGHVQRERPPERAAADIPREWLQCIQTASKDVESSWLQMPSCILTHVLHQECSLPYDLRLASSLPDTCSLANNLLFREKSTRWLQEMTRLTLYAAEWQQLLDMFWGTWWPKLFEQLVSCKLTDIRVSADVPPETAPRHQAVCAQVLPFEVTCLRYLHYVRVEVSVPVNRLWQNCVGVVAANQHHLHRWCSKVLNRMQGVALDAFVDDILQQLHAGVNEGFLDISLPVHVPLRDVLSKLGIHYPNYQYLHSDDVNTRLIRVYL